MTQRHIARKAFEVGFKTSHIGRIFIVDFNLISVSKTDLFNIIFVSFDVVTFTWNRINVKLDIGNLNITELRIFNS